MNKLNIIKSKSGHRIPLIKNQLGYINLHSKYNPINEGEKLIKKISKPQLIISIGLGFGYHLNSINSDYIMAIEDSKTHELLKDEIERKTIIKDKHLKLFNESSIQQLFENISNLINNDIVDCFSIITLPGYKRYNPIFCESILTKTNLLINDLIKQKATINHYKKRWEHNFNINIKHISQSNKYVFEFLKVQNKSVIITAAGPSLIERIEEIKTTKSIIIATDSSLPILKKYDIQPDYVITIDCQHYSLIHYKNVGTNFLKNTILIKDIFSPPSIDKYFNKISIFFPSHNLFIKPNNINKSKTILPIYNTGGNVTHSAVSIAIESGASTIYVYGADFKYTNHKPYSNGVAYLDLFKSISAKTKPYEQSVYQMYQNKKSEKLLHDYKISFNAEFKPLIKSKTNSYYFIESHKKSNSNPISTKKKISLFLNRIKPLLFN